MELKNVRTLDDVKALTKDEILALSGDQLEKLYRRFAVNKAGKLDTSKVTAIVDRILNQAEPAVSAGFEIKPGVEIDGYLVSRHDGNYDGEDTWRCIDEDGDERTFSTGDLYRMSLVKVPTAEEIRKMDSTQYAVALEKFGPRIEKVLASEKKAAMPRPQTQAEAEVLGKAVAARHPHVVWNRRTARAVDARIAHLRGTRLTEKDITDALYEGICAGEIEVDLRKLNLAEKYSFDLVDGRAAFNRISADDTARILAPFIPPEPHWADSLTAAQARENVLKVWAVEGNQSVPAVVRAAQERAIASWRQMYDSHDIILSDGRTVEQTVLDYLRKVRLEVKIQNLVAATRHLAAEGEIAVRDTRSTSYHGTTLTDYTPRNRAPINPQPKTVEVVDRVQRWTAEQIQNLSAAEFRDLMANPEFRQAVDAAFPK